MGRTRSYDPRRAWSVGYCAVAALIVCLSIGASATAQEASSPDEAPLRPLRAVKLRLPLTGSDDQLYVGRLQRAADVLSSIDNRGDKRPLLVIEFAPKDDGAPTEFERALRLARFLVSGDLAAVKTIAYLPKSIDGHAMLVALACEEIAMAPEAELGGEDPSLADPGPVEPSVLAAYEQIALTRRTAPPAVVRAMVDPQTELLRVETESGVVYSTQDRLADIQAEQTIVSQETLSPAGSLAVFTGREGREQGFVKYLTKDRAALGRALGVPADSLLEDLSLTADWRPVMIDLDGPLTRRLSRRVETLIGDELERNSVNWIGLRINSRSGDWTSALSLAQSIAELGDGEVRTVAYVPERAEGPAALVALACDQLVMHEGANLGGTESLDDDPGVKLLEAAEEDAEKESLDEEEANEDEDNEDRPEGLLAFGDNDGADEPDYSEIDSVVATIKDSLAEETSRSWSLLAATADPRLELKNYANRQTGEQRLMGEEELESLEDRADWRQGERIKPAGSVLEIEGRRAEEIGVAWQAVEQFDDLRSLYGFDEAPRTAKPNWALELVEALASPGFAAMLLVVGVVGVYIELNTPGLGVGGFFASVAFLLFFWSKFLDGTADWLEVMLFLSGLVFLLIELVVLPGFGIFGLGGGLLMIAAVVLASQTFILPKTESQLIELRNSLAVVTGSGLVCLGAALVLRHYLPQSPLFRRAMLMPPDEADRIEQEQREQLAHYEHLIGRVGTATTDLLPAGRAEIDGELVDVMTDGDAIDRGERVEVVQASSSRVVVKRVRG